MWSEDEDGTRRYVMRRFPYTSIYEAVGSIEICDGYRVPSTSAWLLAGALER